MGRPSPEIDCCHDDCYDCDDNVFVCHCGTILEYHVNGPDDGNWEVVGHISDRNSPIK